MGQGAAHPLRLPPELRRAQTTTRVLVSQQQRQVEELQAQLRAPGFQGDRPQAIRLCATAMLQLNQYRTRLRLLDQAAAMVRDQRGAQACVEGMRSARRALHRGRIDAQEVQEDAGEMDQLQAQMQLIQDSFHEQLHAGVADTAVEELARQLEDQLAAEMRAELADVPRGPLTLADAAGAARRPPQTTTSRHEEP